MTRDLHLDLLVPCARAGAVVGSLDLSAMLAGVLAGEPADEGDVTAWPLRIADGVEVSIDVPTPIGAARIGLGADDGELVLSYPRILHLALGAVLNAAPKHEGTRTRVRLSPEQVAGLKLPVPGLSAPLGLRLGRVAS